MGAGKTTIGRAVAELTQRPFVDTDEEIEKRHGPIAQTFEERGEAEFREMEERAVAEALARPELAVIALGGGALGSKGTRSALARSFVVWITVDVDEAWQRAHRTDRPLARQREEFVRLFRERAAQYHVHADASAADVEGVLLRALDVCVQSDVGVPSAAAVIADEDVLELHDPPVEGPIHRVPAGEAAKRLDVARAAWEQLDLDRTGTIVAFGGGTTTDLAGFVAATYLRGVAWAAVPTTLVGQVDAAIGGKTGIDLGKGKNLVGAFHYPSQVVLDPTYLRTLPKQERRNGMAEVVKTGLLAGKPLWELPEDEMIRACAAFKCAVCLSDPYERTGRRAILNLGHTFAHALETASDYAVPHGEAVALGLLAALRLSGRPTDVVEEVLSPDPVPGHVDRDRAWESMKRDKKGAGGRVRLVLLETPGKPLFPVELPDADVRRELDRLIAQ